MTTDDQELTGYAASDIETGYAASDIETGYAASDIETGAALPEGVGVFDPMIDGQPIVRGQGKFFMTRTSQGNFYACIHAESELGHLQLCLQIGPAAAAKLLGPQAAPAPVAVGWMSPNQEVVGFNLFHAIKDAGNAIHKAGDFLKIPGWNVTTALLTGHNPIEGLKRDVSNFEQAGQLAMAVSSGNYGKAWELATNGGKIYHPEIPAPPGRDYHPHALWHDHPEAMAYHRALLAPAPPTTGWMGPAQSVVGYALDHVPGSLEHDASPVVRSLGHVADNAARSIAEAAAHHGLDPHTHEEARLVARAHLGDHLAHGEIGRVMRDARLGHPGAQERAHRISRASEFVASHVDMPRILANAIPIPAVRHVAQSGIGLNDPHIRFARSVDALRRGDVSALRHMADAELAEMRGTVSLVPGMGSGVTAAMAVGEHLLAQGHSLEEALRATYGAIPIPAGMRPTTDTVLETLFALLKQPHAMTDGSLVIARDRIPSGVPRDVFDTLVHVVAKHQPIGRDAKGMRGHYVRHYTQGLDKALEHGLRHVLPPTVSKVLGRLPHHKHKFATVNPGLKEIAHVAEELRAGIPQTTPPSGQAPEATGARGRGRGGFHGHGFGHSYRPMLPAYVPPQLPDAGDGAEDEDGDESTGARFGGYHGGRGFGRGYARARHGRHFPHPSYAQPATAPDDGDSGGGDDGGEDGDEATGAIRSPFARRPGLRPGVGPHPGMHFVPGKGWFTPQGIGLDGLPMGHAPVPGAVPFGRPGFAQGYRPGLGHPAYGHPGYAHGRPLPPHGAYPHPYVAPPVQQGQQAPLAPQAPQAPQAQTADQGGGDDQAAQLDDVSATADASAQSDQGAQATPEDADAPAGAVDGSDADELEATNADATDPSVTAGRGGRGGGFRGFGHRGFGGYGGYPHPAPYSYPVADASLEVLGDAGDEATAGEFDMGDPETTGLGVIIPGTYHPSAYAGDEATGFAYGPALIGAAAGAGALYAYQQWQHRRMAEAGAAAGEAANAAAAHAHQTSGEFDMGDPETTAGEFDMGDPMTVGGEFDMGDPETVGRYGHRHHHPHHHRRHAEDPGSYDAEE